MSNETALWLPLFLPDKPQSSELHETKIGGNTQRETRGVWYATMLQYGVKCTLNLRGGRWGRRILYGTSIFIFPYLHVLLLCRYHRTIFSSDHGRIGREERLEIDSSDLYEGQLGCMRGLPDQSGSKRGTAGPTGQPRRSRRASREKNATRKLGPKEHG